MELPTVPIFEATPLASIPAIAEQIHKTFASQRTKSVEYRLVQLRRLYWATFDFEPLLTEAVRQDMRKPDHETILHELAFIRDDCTFAIKNLKKWARDERIEGFPLSTRIFRHSVRKEPIGPSLIIGAYNFPLMTSIEPLIGAIAAGCTAVVKPSENAPASAAAMAHVIAERLDREAYVVVNGSVEQATALLDAGDQPATRWATICYTGNHTVAKIIARRAAETLTPCIFELGGLNPAIITRNANLDIAARRLLWGGACNSGQVCLKQNYILIERTVQDAFLEAMRKQIKTFYPQGVRASPDYARMINERQFQRVKSMVDRTQGRVVIGGEMDEVELFIEPTFVLVDSEEDSTMVEEAFGPVTAVMAFDTLDEAITIANRVCATPLGLYTFGTNAENAKVLNGTTSGGATCNDSFMHGSLAPAPFSGVGTSGTGAYRGKASFDAFTHRRTIATVPWWVDTMMKSRYPPYKAAERKIFRGSIEPTIDFDREGRTVRGLRWWMFWLVKAAGLAVFVKWVVGAVARTMGKAG